MKSTTLHRVVLYSSSTCHPESLIIRAWKRSDKERCTFTGRARWPRPLVARGQWNSMKRNWGPGNIAPAAAERTVAKFSSVGNQVPRTAEPETRPRCRRSADSMRARLPGPRPSVSNSIDAAAARARFRSYYASCTLTDRTLASSRLPIYTAA